MGIDSLLIMGPFILFILSILKASENLERKELERFIKKDKKEEDV
jgi:hypothetical protein